MDVRWRCAGSPISSCVKAPNLTRWRQWREAVEGGGILSSPESVVASVAQASVLAREMLSNVSSIVHRELLLCCNVKDDIFSRRCVVSWIVSRLSMLHALNLFSNCRGMNGFMSGHRESRSESRRRESRWSLCGMKNKLSCREVMLEMRCLTMQIKCRMQITSSVLGSASPWLIDEASFPPYDEEPVHWRSDRTDATKWHKGGEELCRAQAEIIWRRALLESLSKEQVIKRELFVLIVVTKWLSHDYDWFSWIFAGNIS